MIVKDAQCISATYAVDVQVLKLSVVHVGVAL